VYWEDVERFAPEIKSIKGPSGSGSTMRVNWKSETCPALANVEVRRALSIGLDRAAFAAIEGTEDMSQHFYPVSPHYSSVALPLEELPARNKELYTYDPDKARQMIIDAGYPEGFSVRIQSAPVAIEVEKASLVKDQWEEIGVDVTVETFEQVTWRQNMYDHIYDLSIQTGGAGQELYNQLMTHTTPHWTNWSGISDPVYDEMIREMAITIDTDERNAIMREAYLYLHERVPAIEVNPTMRGHFWWPWIKNYYGESNVAEKVFHIPLAHAWIDQDMKKEMGY
jgi:peptide/nickel transport system substrate-binding protein